MKRFVLVLMVLAMVAPLFAVGEKEVSGKVTLRVLHYADATTPGYSVEKKIWDDFRAANPDIELVYEELFNEPFHQKVEAYAAAGKLPDVMYMWPSGRSSTLYNKKLIKDLSPLLASTKGKYLPTTVVPQMGSIIGELPLTITNSHMVYLNTKLLAQLGLSEPKTYADLVAMVPVAKAAGIEVVLMAAKDDWVMQSCLFSMISGRVAGDKFIDDVLAGKAKFTDKPFVDALTVVANMVKDGVMPKNVLQISYGEGPALFAAGKCLMYIDGDWRAGAFITDPTTGKALISPTDQKNVKLTVFPAIPGEKISGSSSTIVGTGFGMNANIKSGSKEEAAAWKLISYMTSPAVAKQRLETGAFGRASWIGVTSDKLEPIQQANAAFSAAAGSYVLDGVLDAKVYTPINIGLQEIVLGIKTPAQVAADTQKAFEDWKANK
ncbi:MAG: extracellular solute-binding protein [Spirochaetales bacterium]|nr:MAG: extracellular solute-binding protein [Spirochaetales bacterium]